MVKLLFDIYFSFLKLQTMNKNSFRIYFIIFTLILFFNIFSKTERIILEGYENRLLNIVEKLFEKDELENLNINEFGYRKTIHLTFKEACKLYIISLKNKNYKLQR